MPGLDTVGVVDAVDVVTDILEDASDAHHADANAHAAHAHAHVAGAGRLSGDFYAADDNVTRGVAFATTSWPTDVGAGSAGLVSSDCDEGLHGAPADRRCGPHSSTFKEADRPPNTPADAFFTFMFTTLFVSGISASRIGNLLIDFLEADAEAFLAKVSREKFSIKAEASIEYLPCTLKIRLYQHEASEYAVEFRRCSGDSVAFNGLFRQARHYLTTNPDAIVRGL